MTSLRIIQSPNMKRTLIRRIFGALIIIQIIITGLVGIPVTLVGLLLLFSELSGENILYSLPVVVWPTAFLTLHLVLICPRVRRKLNLVLPPLALTAGSPFLYAALSEFWATADVFIFVQVNWLKEVWRNSSINPIHLNFRALPIETFYCLYFLYIFFLVQTFSSPKLSPARFFIFSVLNILFCVRLMKGIPSFPQ